MKKICVWVPCYNEEMTVGKVVDDFKKALPEADVLVYDNNCKDKTAEIAKKHGAIVVKAPIQGKGNAVKQMFEEARTERLYDYYIMVDGDDTYPAEDATKLVKLLDEGADMAVGDRLSSTYFEENKRPFHNVGNVTVRFLTNLFFRHKGQEKVLDIMTGYRGFNRKYVEAFHAKSEGFQIETEMTAFALENKMSVKCVPIEYRDRPAGSVSKLSTVKDGVKVLLMIVKLKLAYCRGGND